MGPSASVMIVLGFLEGADIRLACKSSLRFRFARGLMRKKAQAISSHQDVSIRISDAYGEGLRSFCELDHIFSGFVAMT